MGENSAIQWTDHSFNPWRGCVKVAPECDNCYAAVDRSIIIHDIAWGTERQGGKRVVTADWQIPFRWDREANKRGQRLKVFCASLADVFEDWPGWMQTIRIVNGVVTPETLYRKKFPRDQNPIWYGSDSASHEEVKKILQANSHLCKVTMADARRRLFAHIIDTTLHLDWLILTKRPHNIPRLMPMDRKGVVSKRENLWLGTSVGSVSSAKKRVSHLIRQDLSAKRFLSCEPLLQELDLTTYLQTGKIDWVIVGGESGPNARRCDVEWIEYIVRQCAAWKVPCFVKQLGAVAFHHGLPLDLQHKKGGDSSEWPIEFPMEFPVDR